MLILGNQDQRTNKTGVLRKKDISCFCNVDICISSISLQELKILETFLDFLLFYPCSMRLLGIDWMWVHPA